ncbi:tyrosine--tRNA ligase, partial [Candidatus Woesearchaeota archaeon]|nr:tyrosine--tRNA ligase [Candidatus Woesearchaeota archaeon]
MTLSVDERLSLIKEVGEEIIDEEELKTLLKEKKNFIAYDGFEPSGSIHIAQAVLRAINVNKMIAAGAKFTMFVADWHAWANGKLGGDLEKIQTTGKYFIEVWKASGMDLKNVNFIWASELVKDDTYWTKVMQVATNATLKRVLRTTQIMGRSDTETLHASQILYPCMQAADIFHLKADVCQLGMDQRKVNVLARELAPKLGEKKPIIVSHHMLMGLQEPPKDAKDAVERAMAMKMSKSKPNTAIFVTDDEKSVVKKLNKAYCPEGVAEENPVLEYCKYIIFALKDEFNIERPEKFGGNASYSSYEELEKAFVAKDIHPADLKAATAKYINEILQPIRDHFAKDPKAKKLQ